MKKVIIILISLISFTSKAQLVLAPHNNNNIIQTKEQNVPILLCLEEELDSTVYELIYDDCIESLTSLDSYIIEVPTIHEKITIRITSHSKNTTKKETITLFFQRI